MNVDEEQDFISSCQLALPNLLSNNKRYKEMLEEMIQQRKLVLTYAYFLHCYYNRNGDQIL